MLELAAPSPADLSNASVSEMVHALHEALLESNGADFVPTSDLAALVLALNAEIQHRAT